MSVHAYRFHKSVIKTRGEYEHGQGSTQLANTPPASRKAKIFWAEQQTHETQVDMCNPQQDQSGDEHVGE